jgi:uncharacterized membrane protein YvbJ
LKVISADASGNSNSSTLQFIVEAGVSNEQDNQQNTNNNTDSTPILEEKSSMLSSMFIQISILVVALLVLIAFIRVRQNESSDDGKWS